MRNFRQRGRRCPDTDVALYSPAPGKGPEGSPDSRDQASSGNSRTLALADDLKSGLSTVENLMVPKRLGVAEPLAAFGMLTGMVFPVIMFPAAILFGLAELLIPELARCAAAGSQRRIQYLVKRSLRAGLLYGCWAGGLLVLLARPLCLRLYGSNEAGQQMAAYALLVPMPLLRRRHGRHV